MVVALRISHHDSHVRLFQPAITTKKPAIPSGKSLRRRLLACRTLRYASVSLRCCQLSEILDRVLFVLKDGGSEGAEKWEDAFLGWDGTTWMRRRLSEIASHDS